MPDPNLIQGVGIAGSTRLRRELHQARAEIKRLRAIIADLIEGESADEGTPQWYALRNARGALGPRPASDEEQR